MSMDDKKMLTRDETKKERVTPPIGPAFPTQHPLSVDLKGARLTSSQDKITYIFQLQGEVVSIHFDKKRSEIFFKGHNVMNLELDEGLAGSLRLLQNILLASEKERRFYKSYSEVLKKILVTV